MCWLRRAAWLVLIPWAAFWVWFGVASGIGEMAQEGPGALVGHGIQVLVILGAVLLAWRWEVLGGTMLLILAGFGQWRFHPDIRLAVILTIPPAIAGLCLVATGCDKGRQVDTGVLKP